MVSTKTSKKAPVKKGADKERFSLVKSKSGNKIIKLQKGFLMKCGRSIKKFADSYAVYLDFDENAFTLNLDYGKVAISDFMPTGDNWEMWYGDASIPTGNEDVDIVVEAYMFVKPYGLDNDHRNTITSYMDNMELDNDKKQGFYRHVVDTFREVYPEYTGVSDDNLRDVDEFNELFSLILEQSSDIQSIKVTGKMRFFAYDNNKGEMTKIHSLDMNSSADFFTNVEDYIKYMELNAHEEWWTALNKLDEYLAKNGYSASARKSKKVKKNASDFDGRIYEILCAAENEPQQTADDGYMTILDGVPNDVLDQALSYAEGVYGIGIQESARKSKPVVESKPVVKRRQPASAW